ncbi:MAG TPA: efflux RND transporter permease subunit [Pyrinomonadaceae bacterium]|jgi:HAE1 family hydrophobic/amphiphilic exporter-1|nr:efflux RND transporter permease subunit [Pyrinomonadaceae bacterium]
MQKLAEVCIRRPVFAAMIVLSLVVVGAASYFRLGVDRFPSVDLPTVTIRTSLPGASSEEIETLVSQPIEEAVNTVDGMDELRSVSAPGVSIVIATFKLNRNLETAAQDVRDRVSGVISQLPQEVKPPVVQKFDNDSTPSLVISLSGDRSLRELTELADKVVRPRLERIGGVGEVDIVGGVERAINVWVDADRLAAYQIPITSVRQALVQQNADVPGGNVTTDREELVLRTMGRYTDPRGFNDLTIATINGSPVRLRDIGHAEDGTKEQRSLARLNGTPTVTLQILRQSGANTVEVINGIKAALPRVAAQLPADVKMEVIRDQSRYIEAALHEITVHLVLGSLLACLVVLLFMRSWRSTIIAGVAIPASVISTFGMMRALDFTLNSVTMLALVLMVGIVIDDAIVVLENIFRFVEEKRMTPAEAAREATRDIGLAVLATTLSLVVIFLPVSFMSSIAGRFLYQFGITAAVAILVSLLVSFTLTPMMSSRLLRVEDAGGHGSQGHDGAGGAATSRRGFYSLIDRGYTWLLTLSMRHRLVVSVLAVAVIASSVPLYRAVKQEFIPSNVDEAEFEFSVTAPEGTNLAAMNETMQAIERDLLATPGVRLVLTTAGGSFLGAVNQSDGYVRIAPHEERTFSISRLWRETLNGTPLNAWRGNYTQADVMQEVRRRLQKYAPMRAGVRNAQAFNFGTGGRFDIDFVIRGPELTQLARYAEELRVRSQQLGGIVDADTTLKLNKPELRVEIDRDRAAALGVNTQDIADSLRVMVGGDDQVSRFYDASVAEAYDVALRLTERDRDDPRTLGRLYVPSARGGLIRLDNLVRIKREASPSRIDRLDRQRQVSLRASVAPGYAMADRIEALRRAAAEMNMPASYTTAITGKGRELERTFNEFIWAFLLSIIFMYMILASQFESTIHPVTILLSLPLAIPFALASQWMTGDTLNLYSALGILVLFGVVKKNSILQIDHMNNLRAKGMERFEAVIQGNRDRLRPILMTTLALVAGMTPLALGTGPGAEERRSIAVVVIGGQSLSLLLTLLVTPVAYSVFDDIDHTATWRRLAARVMRTPRRAAAGLRAAFARKGTAAEDAEAAADEATTFVDDGREAERASAELGAD